MSYVSFDEVKRVTTIERVASWLGLSGTRMMCPVNQGDKRELAIFPKTQSFCCFGCRKKGKQPSDYSGDLIQLAVHIKGTPPKHEALTIMKEMHGYEPAKRGLPDEGVDKLEYEHERVQKLGISPERAQEYGIAYRDKGTTRKALLIAMRDTKGKLHGYLIQNEDGTLRLPKNMQDL